MRTKLYKCDKGHLFAGNKYASECEECGIEEFDELDSDYVWCGKYGRKKHIIKLDAVKYGTCPCGNDLLEKQGAGEVFRCTEDHYINERSIEKGYRCQEHGTHLDEVIASARKYYCDDGHGNYGMTRNSRCEDCGGEITKVR